MTLHVTQKARQNEDGALKLFACCHVRACACERAPDPWVSVAGAYTHMLSDSGLSLSACIICKPRPAAPLSQRTSDPTSTPPLSSSTSLQTPHSSLNHTPRLSQLHTSSLSTTRAPQTPQAPQHSNTRGRQELTSVTGSAQREVEDTRTSSAAFTCSRVGACSTTLTSRCAHILRIRLRTVPSRMPSPAREGGKRRGKRGKRERERGREGEGGRERKEGR
eukprot:1993291-Rhodomonas_salina.2